MGDSPARPRGHNLEFIMSNAALKLFEDLRQFIEANCWDHVSYRTPLGSRIRAAQLLIRPANQMFRGPYFHVLRFGFGPVSAVSYSGGHNHKIDI